MESPLQDLIQQCRRPRHFLVGQWYDKSVTGESETRISYSKNEREADAFKKQKAKKRLARWWHKSTDTNDQDAPSANKLKEAKMQRFTPEGKQIRIAASLAALDEVPRIRLSVEEWRQLVEDIDIEDQSS